jgi:hypothetical protein
MPSAYIIRKSSNDQYYFSLTAENNEVILTSETYTAKASAQKGVEAVRANAPVDSRYERKTSADGKHYFILRAANNEPIGRSEMYSSPQARDTGIAAVERNAPGAPVKDET